MRPLPGKRHALGRKRLPGRRACSIVAGSEPEFDHATSGNPVAGTGCAIPRGGCNRARRHHPTRARRSGALRATRARLRAPRVPEQDRARAGIRRGRPATARADAGILRLLRLALFGAWPLAARAAGETVPGHRTGGDGTRGAGAQPDAGEHRGRGRVPARAGTHVVRATLRPRVAARTRGRTAQLGRPAGPRLGRRPRAARDRVGPTCHGVAAEAAVPDPLGRA